MVNVKVRVIKKSKSVSVAEHLFSLPLSLFFMWVVLESNQ